jgi:hypothetical protein
MKKMLLTLPENIVDRAKKLSGQKTKSGAVLIALEEYLRQKKIGHLFSRMGQGFGLTSSVLKKMRAREV